MIEAYKKFLESEYVYRKLSWYEKFCNFFDKVKVPIPKDLEKKLIDEINFCHLRITPNGVISTAILFPFFLVFSISLLLLIFKIFSTSFLFIMLILYSIIFYYLFSYTRFLTKHFRAKAASEMTLAVVYMSISMKTNASLEAAVAFAASNLSGPLGLDLKKILWDMETGRLISVVQGIDELIEKWKSESEEFVDALSLLKSCVVQPFDRMENTLKQAVELMIEGTKSRMKKYAIEMRSPLKILNAFGILLPMLGLIFFPMLIIFIPEIAKPELLVFSYTILFPSMVYIFLKQHIHMKPYSYHQVQLENFEEFKEMKKYAIILAIPIALSSFYFICRLIPSKEIFSLEQFLYSYFTVLMISLSVIVYSFLSISRSLKKNEEILKIESELPVALFQLSVISTSSKPIEKNIEDLLPRIKTLEIKKLFQEILSRVKSLGMSFESAIMDEKVGVYKFYPSRIIFSSLRLLVDISKKGMIFLSMALKTMSEFLKDADEVDKATSEILSETTSDMQIQAWVFAPLSAGIVVGLMAVVIYIFSFFGGNLEEIAKFLGGGTIGDVTASSLSFLPNIGKQMPFHYFQIMVGIYMVEMVILISYFLGELNYGEDEVNKTRDMGKIMLIAILVYSLTVLSLYFGVSSFLKLEGGLI
ncbi:MAG: hypothetical protein QXG39_00950 [Candidatus Aenigmatarchaeota archaeon]